MTQMISEGELVKRLLLAVAIGGFLGAERELHRKAAGFRTNILIALGSAVFTIASITLSASGDQARIAAQIVTGIGFLGAGTILRSRDRVHGLTTAATVWVNAALGTAAGAGLFQLALTAGGFTLAVLIILGRIEAAIEKKIGLRRQE